MVVVLDLNDDQRNVGLVEEKVVGTEVGACIAGGVAAAHNDAARLEGVPPVYLLDAAPPGPLDGRSDELLANVRFG